jgi:hypothetical protein
MPCRGIDVQDGVEPFQPSLLRPSPVGELVESIEEFRFHVSVAKDLSTVHISPPILLPPTML